MSRITINGVTYATPFSKLFREHTADELSRLRESIAKFGVQCPLFVYTSHAHGRALIDGIGRATAAREANHSAALPVIDLADQITDAAAEELALTLNFDRRHLSGADYQKVSAARAERMKKVVLAHASGEPLRRIAEAVGVSLGQVQRDLNDASVSSRGTCDGGDTDDEFEDEDTDEDEDDEEGDEEGEVADEDAPVFTMTIPPGVALAKMLRAVATLENGVLELRGTPVWARLVKASQKTAYPMGKGDEAAPLLAALRAWLEAVGDGK